MLKEVKDEDNDSNDEHKIDDHFKLVFHKMTLIH